MIFIEAVRLACLLVWQIVVSIVLVLIGALGLGLPPGLLGVLEIGWLGLMYLAYLVSTLPPSVGFLSRQRLFPSGRDSDNYGGVRPGVASVPGAGLRMDRRVAVSQDSTSEFGKIIELNLLIGESRIVTSGHRSPGGLCTGTRPGDCG